MADISIMPITDYEFLGKLEAILKDMDHKKAPTAKKILDYLDQAKKDKVVVSRALEEVVRLISNTSSKEAYAMQVAKDSCEKLSSLTLTETQLQKLIKDLEPHVNNPAATTALNLFINKKRADKGKERESSGSEEAIGFERATTNSKTVQIIIKILIEYKKGNISGDEATAQILEAAQEALNQAFLSATARLLKAIATLPVFFLMPDRFFIRVLDVFGYGNSRIFGPGRVPQLNNLFEELVDFATKQEKKETLEIEKTEVEKELEEVNTALSSIQEKLENKTKEALESEKETLEEDVSSIGLETEAVAEQQTNKERIKEIEIQLENLDKVETLEQKKSQLDNKLQEINNKLGVLKGAEVEQDEEEASSAPVAFKELLAHLKVISGKQDGYQWGRYEEKGVSLVYQQVEKLKPALSSFFKLPSIFKSTPESTTTSRNSI